MKIDQFLNRILTFIFGTMPDGDRRVWFHSQNLNEDRNGDVKGWPYHGRCWLHSARRGHRTLFHFSWNLWTHFCGIGVRTDHEDGGIQLHFAIPPVSFWLTLPIRISTEGPRWAKWNEKYGGHKGSNRYTSFEFFQLSVHGWALWWEFLKFDWGWSNKMPKWMSGNFNFPDFILGRMDCKTEILETRDVQIPMPEGLYPAKAKLEKRTRSRPRWFSKEDLSVWLDIPQGIPHQGKGEDSWNCGEDGLFGCGAEGPNYEKAIAHAVELVLKDRRRYDGNMMAKYPDPSNRPPPTTPPPDDNMKPGLASA